MTSASILERTPGQRFFSLLSGLLVSASLVFFSIPSTYAASVTLAWDPPTTSTGILGYKLYYGNASRQYTVVTDVGNRTSYQVLNLVEGKTYFFAVTDYNSSTESSYSNEVSYAVPTSVTNHAPVANDGTVTTLVNTQVSGQLVATDADGDQVTYSLVTNVSGTQGTLTVNTTGSFTYVPKTGVTGTDTFTFKAYDGKVYSNVATMTITITQTNRPPVAVSSSVKTTRNTSVSSALGATDPDGDRLTFSIASNGRIGTAKLTNSATGAFTYTPNRNRTGTDTFTFQATDGKLSSKVASVNVTISQSIKTQIASDSSSSPSKTTPLSTSPTQEVVILLEAEEGYVRSPMEPLADPEASGGTCIWVPQGQGSISDPWQDAGFAEYLFNVPVSGTYSLWGRVKSNGSSHNGFYASVDHQGYSQWETALGANGEWVWNQLKEGDQSGPVLFSLQPGEHTLTIKQREDGTKIDQILITDSPDFFKDTIYEDAEDGLTMRWKIVSGNPRTASVANVFDEDRQGHVIELGNSSTGNLYALMSNDMTSWSNAAQQTIEWSMKSSKSFYVYVDVETTAGPRCLVYHPIRYNRLGTSRYVYFGLGSDVIDGRWHTFIHDLQADLQGAQPSVKITKVNGIRIKGGGRIDDVKLR